MKNTQSPLPQAKQSRGSSVLTTDEVAGTSFRSAFAACIAVSLDIRWGHSGQSPELVSELGAASIRGFQGDTLNKNSVLANCFLGSAVLPTTTSSSMGYINPSSPYAIATE